MSNYFRGADKVPAVTVSERHAGRVTILDLEGNITFGEGRATLRKETRRLIAEGRVDVVLNLARVRHVDSSGLGEMVAAQTAARRGGGRVALLGMSPNVRGVFEMTQLVRVFDIYGDEAGAVRGMDAGRD